jgi:poly-gamma-glutamate synthesis protein (capsule biosynthesis protein)
LRVLAASGIRAVGAGADLAAARRGAVISSRGISVAFLAYCELAYIFWSYSYPKWFAAGRDRPGVAPMDEQLILEDVRRAKRNADHVVVSFHWGDEYVQIPSDRQIRLAQLVAEAGASVVLGHHPHVLQPIEVYRGAVIFYSLGNFIFDQRKPLTVDSMIALVTLARDRVVSCEFIPCRIENCCPRPLNSNRARAAIRDMARLSSRRSTVVWASGDRGRVLIPPGESRAKSERALKLLP